jgi:CBS domain-containing protein
MAADESGGELRIADIMEKEVVTIGADATVHDLAKLMASSGVSGMPVVDDDRKVVGMVTEGDLVAEDADLHFPHYIQFMDGVLYLGSVHKFEERLKKMVGNLVGDVMTVKVMTVRPDEPVSHAATIMSRHSVNRVPVVDDDGVLVGIVTRADIIRMLGI